MLNALLDTAEALLEPLFYLLFMWGSRLPDVSSHDHRRKSGRGSGKGRNSRRLVAMTWAREVESGWTLLRSLSTSLLLVVPFFAIFDHLSLTCVVLGSEGVDTDSLALRHSVVQWSHRLGVGAIYLSVGKCFLETSLVMGPVVGVRFLAYALAVIELLGLVVSHWLADSLDLLVWTMKLYIDKLNNANSNSTLNVTLTRGDD